MVAISSLAPDPANARKHNERNLAVIAASLKRFGQQKPIVVDANGIVRAGNGTLEAARALGWSEIWIARTELVGVEAAAYGIADNRSAELAEWDTDILSELLKESDMGDVGFTQEEILELLSVDSETTTTTVDSPEDFKTVDENIPTEHICPKCGYAFSGGK